MLCLLPLGAPTQQAGASRRSTRAAAERLTDAQRGMWCASPDAVKDKRIADGLAGHEDQPTVEIGPRVVGRGLDALRCGAGPHCGAEWPISCMSRHAVPTLENVRYLGNMV
jgi:hypothetical protein